MRDEGIDAADQKSDKKRHRYVVAKNVTLIL